MSQINSVHALQFNYFKIQFNSSFHPRQGLPSDVYPSRFPTKILYVFLRSPHVPRLLGLITRITLYEQNHKDIYLFLCYSYRAYSYNYYVNQLMHLIKYNQKYKTTTCFGTGMPSSGSYLNKRVQG
jgi:hypothetical protein